MDKNFTHLHVHDHYSFLDGYGSPKKHARRAKELGMKALATTNHNHLGSAIEFQKACKDNDIKPLLGLESYWTWDTEVLSLDSKRRNEMAIEKAIADGVDIPEKNSKNKDSIKELLEPYEYDTKQHHILFIAINQTGWHNLVKLQSEAAEKCTFNARYLCDDKIIEKYNEGLIMTTACIGNVLGRLILQGRYEEAEAQLDKWHSIFKERFYIEIQPLNINKQRLVNFQLIKWAKEKNIKLIATNDVHWTYKEDHDDHDTLLCIGIGKTKSDKNRLKYSNDFWLKSYEEMIESFEEQSFNMADDFEELFCKEDYMEIVKEALENTNHIADMVEDIKLGSDTPVLPEVEVPEGMTAEQYFTIISYQALYKYSKEHPEINLKLYERRLNEEIDIINSKGYAPYMLIVKDYVDYCDRNDIPVGTGRGSAGGSLALFLNKVIKVIDPVKYGLLFFRFLTKDRTALPDIDLDFSYYKRHLVIEYLKEKYGVESIANIGTYTEMGVKSGLKDVGRVLDIDFKEMNDLSKKITEWTNDAPSVKFKDLDAYKESIDERERKAWIEFDEYEERYKELFRLARAFEGTKRNSGVHASGVLITPMPISGVIPTRLDKSGNVVALYTGVELEELNYVKFDILGLRTLDVLDKTMKAIDKKNTILDLYDIIKSHTDDKKIFKMIQDKETDGLFQIESPMFKGLVSDIRPNHLNDITAITSIGRPGPLSAKMDKVYAERKLAPDLIEEPIRGTMEIVKDSLGTIIYQESIMEIAIKVAKVNQNQADSLFRKAISKKNKDLFEICRRVFVYGKINTTPPQGNDNTDKILYDELGKYGPEIIGGINNGYEENELNDFFKSLEGYSSYLFNKSHACFYSSLTLCTAYLKKYHSSKFMAALLSVQDKQEKIEQYSKVSKEMKIEISTPDINLSNLDFTATDQTILYGLGSIKGIGETSINPIIDNKPYKDIKDFIDKTKSNKTVVNALIKAGAFDFINKDRHKLLNDYVEIALDIDLEKRELAREEKRAKQEEEGKKLRACKPLKRKTASKDDYIEKEFDREACIEMEEEVLGSSITYTPWWDEIKKGETVEIELELSRVSETMDKNGNMMAFLDGVSNGCDINCVVFSRTYVSNMDKFDMDRNKSIYVKGKKGDRGNLVVSSVPQRIVNREFEDIDNRLRDVI